MTPPNKHLIALITYIALVPLVYLIPHGLIRICLLTNLCR